jgi:hypothetical protein
MPEYRIYTILEGGRIAGPSDNVDCADDDEAVNKAIQLANGSEQEVWNNARLIARIPKSPPKA